MKTAALLAYLAACTPTWYRAQVAAEATTIAGLACDGGSTQQYLSESGLWETNPILGHHPSDGATWSYLAAIGVALIGVDHLALDRWPTWGPRIATGLAAVVAGVEIESNAVNMHYGASLCGVGVGGPWAQLPTTARSGS